MKTCKFCNSLFTPRYQTKNPRACFKKGCQLKRQRLNEREWRIKNNFTSDPEYHRLRRKQRIKVLNDLISMIYDCVVVGSKFLNRPIKQLQIKIFLTDFIFQQGIRRAKKLWKFKIPRDFQDLDSSIELSLL